jgi:hypothetical protein
MHRKLVSLVIGGGLLALAGVASAQEADLAVEGPGYPVGEGTVVHPVLGAELGFTDNVFYEEGGQQNASGILRLLAEASIASKDPEPEAQDPLDADAPAPEPPHQSIQFRAGGMLSYYEYLSGSEVVRSQRNLGADLHGNIIVNPQGVIAFEAFDRFVRDTRPTNFESFSDTNRDSNSLGLGLKYQPGGRQITAALKWENFIDYFEDPDQRYANRMINTSRARGEWAFFPYSKAYLDLSYGFIGGFGNTSGMASAKRSAQPIRGGLGVATAITEMFTVKANVGWAYAAYEGGASYNSPVLGGEVGFRYSPMGRFIVEYAWEKKDSINSDFYSEHYIGGRIDQQLSRFVLTGVGGVRWRTYEGIPMEVGAPTRDDLIFNVGARLQYAFRDWMAAVADWRTEVDQTDYRTMFGGDTDDPSYVRTEVTAGVRAAF